jgi:hypothetical protein
LRRLEVTCFVKEATTLISCFFKEATTLYLPFCIRNNRPVKEATTLILLVVATVVLFVMYIV